MPLPRLFKIFIYSFIYFTASPLLGLHRRWEVPSRTRERRAGPEPAGLRAESTRSSPRWPPREAQSWLGPEFLRSPALSTSVAEISHRDNGPRQSKERNGMGVGGLLSRPRRRLLSLREYWALFVMCCSRSRGKDLLLPCCCSSSPTHHTDLLMVKILLNLQLEDRRNIPFLVLRKSVLFGMTQKQAKQRK